MKLNKAIFAALTMVMVGAACAPQGGGSAGAGDAPAAGTEWKEGYGGDVVAIEVRRMIEKVCFSTRALRAKILSGALETNKDVSVAICGLLETDALVIEPVVQPMVNGVDKDYANYPNQTPKRLEVKRAYWTNSSASYDDREALLLHELMSLIGLEDLDLVRSGRLQIAIGATFGQVNNLSCDEKRLEAFMAGASSELMLFYMRDMGSNGCEPAYRVIARHATSKNLEEKIAVDLTQAYLLGSFMGIMSSNSERKVAGFLRNIRAMVEEVPNIGGPFSGELCTGLLNQPVSATGDCMGFLHLMVGAHWDVKHKLGSVGATLSNFDRASIQVLNVLRTSTPQVQDAVGLTADGNISAILIQKAIEAQNWPQLSFLGRIQQMINPGIRPSKVLLPGINWSRVAQIRNNNPDPADLNREHPLIRCTSVEIEEHATFIVDGVYGPIRCGTSLSI